MYATSAAHSFGVIRELTKWVGGQTEEVLKALANRKSSTEEGRLGAAERSGLTTDAGEGGKKEWLFFRCSGVCKGLEGNELSTGLGAFFDSARATESESRSGR